MLKWIVGAKVNHPLAEPKEARALVAELPATDYLQALDDITRWLEALVEAEGFKLERLFEIVEMLDTAARPRQRRLLQDYLGMSRQQKVQESKLWTCGFKASRALGAAYLACVRQYRDGGAGAAAVRKTLPALAARGVRALAVQVKWTMLRYGPFEPALWRSIGEIYDYAHKSGFARDEVALQANARGTSSVEQEYLKVLMLWASSADVLPPLKQEIAERAVNHYAGGFRLGAEPFPGALYAFDPARDQPPVRRYGDPAAVPGLCYFGPGTAAASLGEALTTIERTGALPATVSLGAPYPAETVQSVLRHLAQYWSGTPPARASERRETTARITVVPGYFALLDELERDESDALNFSVSSAESWVVENVSENGYGALVPASTSDWIRVGELIGLQVEGTPQWGVGLVRRVTRDEQRQYRVGIEIISRSVLMVRIAGEAGESDNAVLLSGTPDANGEVGLIMRAGRFDPNLDISVTRGASAYQFHPARLVDAGDDFDWALFRIGPADA